ncbi:Uncharacterised protein [Escherichia coli]|uniref:Uncharacterized protein n=1 Tax=Escherichia coli TaxID=562 RepID=A0A2X3JP08_ECOLX|nr:Uncharacterised protein [Escherichia coli]
MLTTVAGNLIAVYRAAIACITAVIVHGIGIEDFTPFARLVYAEAIIMTRYRRKVTGNDDFVTLFIATHKISTERSLSSTTSHSKPYGSKSSSCIAFMVAVGEVQIAHQTLDTVVPVIAAFQQMPVEAGVMVPLAALGKFVTHEQ